MVNKRKVKQKNKEDNYCARNYKEVWNYIKECRLYIYIIVGLFLISSIIAGVFGVPGIIEQEIVKIIQELIAKTAGMNSFELMWFILKNNVGAALLSLILGVVFGVFPIISAAFNGYILGYVSRLVIFETSWIELWRLIPHGIFELPAIFLAMALGMKFGMFVFSGDFKNEFKRRLRLGIKTFVYVVLPLLVIAAIIEGALIGLGI
jgi:stage II sporulation protein M